MSKLTRKNFVRSVKIIKAVNRMISKGDMSAWDRGREIIARIPMARGNNALASLPIPGAYSLVLG